MNNSIYIFASSLCVTLVICSVIRLVLPSGNTQRIMSVVISVFVLCCLFSPVINIIRNFKLEFNEDTLTVSEAAFNEIQNEQIIEQTANCLNEYINSFLLSKGIEDSQIKTTLATNNERGIYIKELCIYLDKEHTSKSDEVKEWIKELVGREPKIMEC